ncbi:MAG: HK97 family phage prohead protease [Rhizobiales bacterium]|nr:HK97 family phage prohead protease [Hyphomicrobiales bacterium]
MAIKHKAFDLAPMADGWIMASTPAVDRDADRVMPLGIDCTNYRKNPVLIFGHNYSEPWCIIGKAGDITADESGLRILPELRDPASQNDPMHIVKALWEQGLLRAASIGFRPVTMQKNAFGGNDILTSELLEVSIVPIPANQDALRLAVKALPPEDDMPEDMPPEDAPEPTPEDTPADAPEPEQEDTPTDGEPTEEDALAMLELRLTAILSDFLNSIRSSLEAINA